MVWLIVPLEGRKRAQPRKGRELERVGYVADQPKPGVGSEQDHGRESGAGTADGEGHPSPATQNRGANSGSDRRGAQAEDQGRSLPCRRCPNGVDEPTRSAREDDSTLPGERSRPVLHHPRRRVVGPCLGDRSYEHDGTKTRIVALAERLTDAAAADSRADSGVSS